MDAIVSRLIALGPRGSLGGDYELTHGFKTVGRSHTNDLVLSEPTVSRVHASLTVDSSGRVSVQDLGSSAGTTVNGRPASGQVVLHSGDVVAFGGARFEYQGVPEKAQPTAVLPLQRADRPLPRAEHIQGRYDIENQHAGNISNVAGNQYTAYVSHVRQERESFLRDIAATKTWARWLIWVGLGLTIAGLVIVGANFLQFMEGMPTYTGGAIPAAFRGYIIGIYIVGGGQLFMIIGIVLHVVATSRRKRVDREFPLPRPGGP
ncbi:FHA domain-containing protein [Arthrobacter sp. SLBN-100]|uniref:FHA domain-containing protein n=1 Tax=Arthrobacter sp. SLBN-100 TaxID=2768450 RepID=UPI0011502445|nr:FHA domain-containing protein [Arthrobacter sp. SLBN-100]TQJ67751.1 FHA domain-containing protein [Arthrobacter sp. SLBN-100]